MRFQQLPGRWRWTACFGLFVGGMAAGFGALSQDDPGRIGLFAWVGLLCGAALGAPLGLTERRGLRIAWLSGFPGVVGLGGPLLVLLLTRNEPDGGGLATAAMIGVLVTVGAALGATSLLYAGLGRALPTARPWVFLGLGAVATVVGTTDAIARHPQRLAQDQGSGEASLVDPWVQLDPTGGSRPKRHLRTVRIDPAEFPLPDGDPSPAKADTIAEVCTETRSPALLRAVIAREFSTARALLRQGANPDACFHHGEGATTYPLQRALEDGSFDLAQLLLASGANPNLASRNEPLPLELAGRAGRMDLVESMIAAGADVQAVSSGAPLLFHAVIQGDVVLVRRLLHADANPYVGFAGVTALEKARAEGAEEIARMLEAAGAGPDFTGAFTIAAANGEAGALRRMHGYPMPALIVALAAGHREIALDLARKAELDMTSYPCQVLGYAARKNDVEVLAALFSRVQVVRVACLEEASRESMRVSGARAASTVLLEQLRARIASGARPE